jgi:hypothetical protein
MELQLRYVAGLHGFASRKGDLDAWIGYFTVDVWRGTGDVRGGTAGVNHGRTIVRN